MSEQIRQAVRKILHEPSYAERARTPGAQISESDALQTISPTIIATLAKLG